MARQISMEAGIEAYRQKCADLLHANVLLEAANAELEAELEKVRVAPSDGTYGQQAAN
ncbi:hypothetical protein ABZ401_19430 [Streptomyces sp. NPDC005892]|uniref:hypothetical protein n=1 Tax=Streptomyces sp. NPDC005892 TaxID=3155593 RepID=UPI0033CBB2E0